MKTAQKTDHIHRCCRSLSSIDGATVLILHHHNKKGGTRVQRSWKPQWTQSSSEAQRGCGDIDLHEAKRRAEHEPIKLIVRIVNPSNENNRLPMKTRPLSLTQRDPITAVISRQKQHGKLNPTEDVGDSIATVPDGTTASKWQKACESRVLSIGLSIVTFKHCWMLTGCTRKALSTKRQKVVQVVQMHRL
jgi:hypothetical protein